MNVCVCVCVCVLECCFERLVGFGLKRFEGRN